MKLLSKIFHEVIYAENKISGTDMRLSQLMIDKFCWDKTNITRQHLNYDGESVTKSPATSAWPLLIFIAYLSLILRQSFKNIALASLFVGIGQPSFIDIFDNLKVKLDVVERVRVEIKRIKVSFCPLFFFLST